MNEDETINNEDEITVILTSAGTDNIAVLKEIRNITNFGLIESKNIVDSAPIIIKEGLNKSEALAIKKTLEDVGATVEFKKTEPKIESKEEIQTESYPNSNNEEKLVYERQNSSAIFGFVQFITFALSLGVGIYVGSTFGVWWGVLGFILGMIFFYLYFLPANISEQKDHHQTGAICLTNIFPAFWPIALVWALALKSNVPKGYEIVEQKSVADKISNGIDNVGKSFDKFDKKMDEKLKQLEDDTKSKPKKHEKINKISGWIGIIFFAIVAILTIVCIIDTQIHSNNLDSSDFYGRAKLSAEEGDGYVDDYAVAINGGKYGLVNKKNEFIIKPKYANAQNIQGDYFFGCKDAKGEKCAYIEKKSGKELTDFAYIGCGNGNTSMNFSNGMALVIANTKNDVKTGYINKNGKEIIKPQFSSGNNFKNGIAEVYINENDTNPVKINKKGEIIK